MTIKRGCVSADVFDEQFLGVSINKKRICMNEKVINITLFHTKYINDTHANTFAIT